MIPLHENYRHILGIDIFDPVYFAMPGISEIIVNRVEKGKKNMIRKVFLHEDGRINNSLHRNEGWIAYPTGTEPDIGLNHRMFVKYEPESENLLSEVRDTISHELVEVVACVIENQLLLRKIRTVHPRKNQVGSVDHTIFIYNDKEELMSLQWIWRGGRMKKVRMFRRDLSGNIIHETLHLQTWDPQGNIEDVVKEFKYSFDEEVRLTLVEVESKEYGGILKKLDYLEDSNRPSSITTFTADGGEDTRRYTYDEVGRIQSMSSDRDQFSLEYLYT